MTDITQPARSDLCTVQKAESTMGNGKQRRQYRQQRQQLAGLVWSSSLLSRSVAPNVTTHSVGSTP